MQPHNHKQKFVECRLSCPLLSLLFTSRMKTHIMALLVAVLVFATLITESDCLSGNIGTDKRHFGEKV